MFEQRDKNRQSLSESRMISAILHLPARALVSPQDFGMKLLTWDVGMRMFTGKPSGTGTNNISKSLKMDLKYLIKVSGEIALRIWFLSYNMCVLVAQSCPTLCDPMDCSPPGSSVHGIFQAKIMGWVAILFSRGVSWPRDRIRVSRLFTIWATWEALNYNIVHQLYLN